MKLFVSFEVIEESVLNPSGRALLNTVIELNCSIEGIKEIRIVENLIRKWLETHLRAGLIYSSLISIQKLPITNQQTH